MWLVNHFLHYPAPQLPSLVTFDFEFEDSTDPDTISVSKGNLQAKESTTGTGKMPYIWSQAELQDLARDLNLSKEKSELHGSKLKQWILLQNEVNITFF